MSGTSWARVACAWVICELRLEGELNSRSHLAIGEQNLGPGGEVCQLFLFRRFWLGGLGFPFRSYRPLVARKRALSGSERTISVGKSGFDERVSRRLLLTFDAGQGLSVDGVVGDLWSWLYVCAVPTRHF